MKTRLMIIAGCVSALTLSCIKVDVNDPGTGTSTSSQPLNTAVVGESVDTNSYSLGVSLMNNILDSKSRTVHYNLPAMEIAVGGVLNSGSIKVEVKRSDNSVIFNNTFSNILGYNEMIAVTPDDYTIKVDFINASGELGLDINADS